MRRLGLIALLASAGCSRCNSNAAPDAAVAEVADAGAKAEATDVRTALFTLFPEFRGAHVISGRAQLSRQLQFNGDLDAEMARLLAQQGFDGGVRDRFLAQVEGDWISIALDFGDADIGHLLQSPAPITSEQLAYYLPTPPGAKVLEEQFSLTLEYEASPERADFLIRQLYNLLTAGEWKPKYLPPDWPGAGEDGGVGKVPEAFTLILGRARGNTEIKVVRGKYVVLSLTQPTR